MQNLPQDQNVLVNQPGKWFLYRGVLLLVLLGLSSPVVTMADKNRVHMLLEQGQIEAAAEIYRTVLMATGPNAEVNFLLAELQNLLGELAAARERYYAAIELDEDYVEARANLCCVLSEMGQYDLAVAAFKGALAFHDDYPDVHYHLARTLDGLNRRQEAELHWRAFLALVPDSPWTAEARDRLDEQ